MTPALHRPTSILKSAALFLAAGTSALAASLGAYVMAVETAVPDAPLPSTYKWFLLAETPGERIIIESGSNSHHGVDAALMSELTGRTTINIADNGGYDLADKVSRLERHARPGDVVILPLEWSYFTRDSVTEDYLDVLLAEQAAYYNSLPLRERVGRALSFPPALLVEALTSPPAQLPSHNTVVLESLMAPHGGLSFSQSRGPGAGVAEQTCDAYLQGALDANRLAPRFLGSLDRLAGFRAKGVEVYFAWPAMAGDACFTDAEALRRLQADVEEALAARDIPILNTVSASLFPASLQDDTPYHLISAAAEARTRQLSAALAAHGVSAFGETVDLTRFARQRLYELERATIAPATLAPIEIGQTVRPGDAEDSARHLGLLAGWWDQEPYGRWMRADRAAFMVRLPDDVPADGVLRLDTRIPEGSSIMLSAAIGGRTVARGPVGNGEGFDIPVAGLATGSEILIDLTLDLDGEPQSPASLGGREDLRTLSLHLQGVSLLAQPGAPAAIAAIAPPSEPLQPPSAQVQPVRASLTDDFLAVPAGLGDGYGDSFCMGSQSAMDLLRPHVGPVAAPAETQVVFGDGWWSAEPEGR